MWHKVLLPNCNLKVRYVFVLSLLMLSSRTYCLYANVSILWSYLMEWMKQMLPSESEVLLTDNADKIARRKLMSNQISKILSALQYLRLSSVKVKNGNFRSKVFFIGCGTELLRITASGTQLKVAIFLSKTFWNIWQELEFKLLLNFVIQNVHTGIYFLQLGFPSNFFVFHHRW